ncbi:NACHT, LRR and PYD domains-containing protein 1 homolog [Sardina pilchardus]|uniref:NACHT, LRR and PYD domains-containing protein 1 homolog n=1 Tax=Sardina pilchardus TaxID=27697 RepID=UPI002E149E8E
MSKRKWRGDITSEKKEWEEEDQAGPSSQVKLSQKEKELQTSTPRVMDPDPDGKKKRSRDSKGGVSSSDSDSVQQGASDTESKRPDGTRVRGQRDSTAGHRWKPEEAEVHEKFRSTLKSKFQHLNEGVPNQGETRLLHEIYTDLYITEGGGWVNDEHEVRQIERASWRKAAQIRPIKCSDIFKPFSGQHKPIRTVMTKGVAGIGKTVSVQKFILDWTEGETNQDVHFIFPLPFRELNLMMDKQLSLVKLLQHFFPEIKDLKILTNSKHKVMFIFDGLDECRLPLDFRSNLSCCDVTTLVSVNVLLTNLIKRNLLPSALLWITTRPAAASQIPPEYVDQVTEIRGFNAPQKEEYFKKYFKTRTSDENLASRTITHLKSSRSLYIMCHIPVFCWISATVVERASSESEKVGMPRTLTQMYTHFLIIQTSITNVKYTERKETDEEIVFKLAKMAFQQLEKGNLIFYEEDLRECGIDVTEASVYSGVCTQIFREESGLYQGKVFSFVHLSIQEFLAAVYVFLCFRHTERSMSDHQQTSQLSGLFRAGTLHDLHKTAVDLALQSENGHLDLFLRFLLGLSLESNQELLMHLLPQTRSQPQSYEQTVQYIKQKIRDKRNSDKKINLFYCLNELNRHAVVEVIEKSSGALFVETLLPGQWETRTFGFKIPEEQLDEFDLQKYIKTPETDQTELLSPDEVLQRLVPVVTSALLFDCSLTEKSCAAIASAAISNSCSLKELNLSYNELHDAGVQHISELLKNPHCKLETLWLVKCSLTEKSCAAIASAAISNSCSLKELKLSYNELHDAGVQHLSELLKNPHCMYSLVDDRIFLKESPAAAAASASSSHSDAAELHLRDKVQQDPGAQLLSLDTHTEDHHMDAPQRSCESCTEVPDSSHWVLVKPEVSTEESVSTYSLSSPAGSYECPESGLRWTGAGPVTLQYRFIDWHLLADELPHMQYRPAGPSVDIKVISGELEEIHLPHFLCLGGSPSSLKDAVEVLHKQDSGVLIEKCELSRFHAKLVNPSFSLLGPFYSLMSLFLPGKEEEREKQLKIHADVQVYQSSTVPLTFRTYLLPEDAQLRKLLEDQEESYRGHNLKKPRPVRPLQMHEFYALQTDCNSMINPVDLDLRYSSIAPNFFEVSISEASDFSMELLSCADRQRIWQAGVKKTECRLDNPHQSSDNSSAAKFLRRHRSNLVKRVKNVMAVADEMFSQGHVKEEDYANIRVATPEQEKMRRMLDCCSTSAQGALLNILQRECPDLMEELGQPAVGL